MVSICNIRKLCIDCSYISLLLICIFFLFQALLHASVACRRKLCIDWVPASDLEVATSKEVSNWSFFFFFWSFHVWSNLELTVFLLSLRIPMPIEVRGLCWRFVVFLFSFCRLWDVYVSVIYIELIALSNGSMDFTGRRWHTRSWRIWWQRGGG